jgi:hypothetical protein
MTIVWLRIVGGLLALGLLRAPAPGTQRVVPSIQVPDRSVDERWTVRCEISPDDPAWLEVETWSEAAGQLSPQEEPVQPPPR